MTVAAHRVAAGLEPDPSRVIARLFAPGGSVGPGRSRVRAIADRVIGLNAAQVERLAADITRDFADRHDDLAATLTADAAIVAGQVGGAERLGPARTLVLGAGLTAEYATEAAALCNPSAVAHPDQSGLAPGQLRVAVSLRAIGEGHVSSIAFVEAVIGPGSEWAFTTRDRPLITGVTTAAPWPRERLRAALADHAGPDLGGKDALVDSVLDCLPDPCDPVDVERAIVALPGGLRTQPNAAATIDLIRRTVTSGYLVDFPAGSSLSQRVLQPQVALESNGVEDARFTRFVDDDGRVEYRATYTAYDGHRIAPRLLISPDLRCFTAGPLAGPAAANKGMALFPRPVDGRFLSLCRTDGETISLAESADGFRWSEPTVIHRPTAAWELVQVGNCGPPIETDRGWLVLTHGVGPLRTYSIGAILLDLHDPTRVVGSLLDPLLTPSRDEQNGYVPNVLYSCGGVVHDGRLWVPFGVGDARIAVAWVDLAELLDALTSADTAAAVSG